MSSNIYTNNPNQIAINRINFDKNLIIKNKDNLDQEGIYFHFPENNTINTVYYSLIIGPPDTPYSGGFYIFKGQFPDIYPFKPMTMKSLTQGGKVRKHPNLYVCGKCCFSFLGTWSGPPWTPCNNSEKVAISMRSVMTKFPLENEPGWENINARKSEHNMYAELIKYFNLKYAVCNILENIDTHFTYFKEPIIKNFSKNYNNYIEEISNLSLTDSQLIKSPVYGFEIFIDKKLLINKMHDLYAKYIGYNNTTVIHSSISKCTDSRSSTQEKDCIKEKETIVNDIVKEFPDKGNASKNSKPSQPASQFDKDYIYKVSETLSYKVIEYKRNNKTCKRWLKCKT